jgi:hypothetical protein
VSLLNPASDLATFLTTKVAGGVTLTLGTNLFSGRMLSQDSTPTRAVFVLNTGGQAPAPYLSGTARESYYAPSVQVLVRGPVQDFQAGESMARGVFELLHQATIAGYVQVLARDSAPVLLELDSAQRGIWAINLDCEYTASLP